jgi:uncharacterized membrane protein YkvI
MLILGTVIGAGFASGKELVLFFAGFGWYACFAAVLAGALFFAVIMLFFRAGEKIRAQSIHDVTLALCPRAPAVLDIFLLFNYTVLLGSMFGGSDALTADYVGFPFAGILTLVLTFVVVYFGIKGVSKINNVLVPVIMLLLVAVCVFNIARPSAGNTAVSIDGLILNILNIPVYVGMNMMLASGVLFGIRPDRKTAFLSALISSVIITLFIILIVAAVLAGGYGVLLAEMPIIVLSRRMNIGVLSLVIIWLGIFTSVIAAAYTLHASAKQIIRNKALSLLVVLILGYIVSRQGFRAIVEIYYPISGIVGIAFVFITANYLRKNKAADIMPRGMRVKIKVK